MTSKNYGQTGVAGNVEFGKEGPRIRDDAAGAAMGVRNQADDDYIPLRVGAPVNENDAVSKKYLETRADVRVTGQIDGGSPPAPSTPGRIFICTTAGGSYTLKYLYRDSGTSWEEIIPGEGLTIRVTDDLTGGTDEYIADHIYLWDADNSIWKDMGPNPAESDVIKGHAIEFDYTDTVINLIRNVPSGARALRVKISVTQIFDGVNPEAEVGDAVDPDRLMPANENNLKRVDVYVSEVLYLYGSATDVNLTLTIGGTPTQGQGVALIEYLNPVGI